MNIHYFQRYYQKENVSTANTMLLLSRLYNFSVEKYYKFLSNIFEDIDNFKVEPEFNLQVKSEDSVPDAMFTQSSIRIVIETKNDSNNFVEKQLLSHLNSFEDEKYKVLISLSPEHMNVDDKKTIDNQIKGKKPDVVHINVTFEELAQGIQNVLTDHDYEMQVILDDYVKYCEESNLVVPKNKLMAYPVTNTYDLCKKENVYYRGIEKAQSYFEYIGLYKDKKILAIGKINTIISTIYEIDGEISFINERGELSDEIKEKIESIVEERTMNGEEVGDSRYYFVDCFYDTSFQKDSSGGLQKAKKFDLLEVLKVNDKDLPTTETIAEMLKGEKWQ